MKISKIFKKILSIGTPPEKDILYKHVVKKKVPNESAEQLTLTDFKKSLKNIFSHEDERIEFSRGTPSPPVKMAAKKTPEKKKITTKKASTTKKPAVKKAPTKKSTTSTKTTATTKSVTKKSTSTAEKPTAKKTVTKKKTTVATKTTAKKPAEKKVSTKKTVAKKPVAKKATTSKIDKSTATTKAAAVKKAVTKKSTVSSEKPATKKVTEKKTKNTTTKAPTKKTPTKTATEKKTKAAPRGAKKAEKIALYIKDITKHYGEVDEDFLAIIVKNLGPSIYKRDAELVSCSDPKELDTVRKNFLIKKLGIDAGQKVLDAAIQDVCEELKATRTKYRATFYYRLAKKFKKESFLS